MKSSKNILLTVVIGTSLMFGSVPSVKAEPSGTAKIATSLVLFMTSIFTGFYKYDDGSKFESLGKAWAIVSSMASGLLLRDGIGQNEAAKTDRILDKVRRENKEALHRAGLVKKGKS